MFPVPMVHLSRRPEVVVRSCGHTIYLSVSCLSLELARRVEDLSTNGAQDAYTDIIYRHLMVVVVGMAPSRRQLGAVWSSVRRGLVDHVASVVR